VIRSARELWSLVIPLSLGTVVSFDCFSLAFRPRVELWFLKFHQACAPVGACTRSARFAWPPSQPGPAAQDGLRILPRSGLPGERSQPPNVFGHGICLSPWRAASRGLSPMFFAAGAKGFLPRIATARGRILISSRAVSSHQARSSANRCFHW
jgi:hypothetical protein